MRLLEDRIKIIRHQPGCTYLELLADVHDANRATSYSHWESEDDLNNYRHSDFFKDFWPKVKALLDSPAVAHSYQMLEKLP